MFFICSHFNAIWNCELSFSGDRRLLLKRTNPGRFLLEWSLMGVPLPPGERRNIHPTRTETNFVLSPRMRFDSPNHTNPFQKGSFLDCLDVDISTLTWSWIKFWVCRSIYSSRSVDSRGVRINFRRIRVPYLPPNPTPSKIFGGKTNFFHFFRGSWLG